MNPAPVMVTEVPPALVPELGTTLTTAGVLGPVDDELAAAAPPQP